MAKRRRSTGTKKYTPPSQTWAKFQQNRERERYLKRVAADNTRPYHSLFRERVLSDKRLLLDLERQQLSRSLMLKNVQDGRRFNLDKSLARTVNGNRARLRAKPEPYRMHFVEFVNPKRVITCIRRKVRKEVIHALHIRGGSGSLKRKPHNKRNQYSEVHC